MLNHLSKQQTQISWDYHFGGRGGIRTHGTNCLVQRFSRASNSTTLALFRASLSILQNNVV